MYYLCITPSREDKTRMFMEALNAGFVKHRIESKIIIGKPPKDENCFIVWGQEWTALESIPEALKSGRPFWHIDNGFWNPGRGSARGYYRFTYCSMTPRFLPEELKLRHPTILLTPWKRGGSYVLIAMPGVHFGMAMGINVADWCGRIVGDVRDSCAEIGKPIKIRERNSRRPLKDDFKDAYAVVTHSSNVGVDAAIAGVPVFVAPTSPAAPVGRTDLNLADPITPGRNRWLRSLASQHFTVDEMRRGIAAEWIKKIEDFVKDRENGEG